MKGKWDINIPVWHSVADAEGWTHKWSGSLRVTTEWRVAFPSCPGAAVASTAWWPAELCPSDPSLKPMDICFLSSPLSGLLYPDTCSRFPFPSWWCCASSQTISDICVCACRVISEQPKTNNLHKLNLDVFPLCCGILTARRMRWA